MKEKIINLFNLWREFPKHKPPISGWYQCTLHEDNMEKTVMDLYWDGIEHVFYDNRRRIVYHIYRVYDNRNNLVKKDRYCNRTEGVIAWKYLPSPYRNKF